MTEAIKKFWDFIFAVTDGFWRVLDEKKGVRRGVLAFGLVVQYQSLQWAYNYAISTSIPGTPAEKAAMVAAILGVVSTLVGAIFGFYAAGRKNSNEPPPQ
jgi:hypothetical protein